MAGKHAKRTTVKRIAVGLGVERWAVELATFDRPSTAVTATRDEALDIAHRFERSRARARFIETNRAERWAQKALELDYPPLPSWLAPKGVG